MNRSILWRQIPTLLVLLLTCLTFADEWKPSHALVSPTGVMNLSDLPPPGEVFFSGPESPADASAWSALGRIALTFVGSDPAAEEYWVAAINNPNLPEEEMSRLFYLKF